MGLGPPVCRTCKVIYTIKDKKWICGTCGKTDTKDHLWELDKTSQEEYMNKLDNHKSS